MRPAVAAGLELLQQLLRIESTPGAGRETEAARLLLAHAQRHGLPAEVVEPAPGAGSFVARLGGAAAPQILLHSHLDVVDAGPVDNWTAPPFAGAIADGSVWGRGAVDLKGLVAAHFAVLLTLREDLDPPPVMMAAVAEEESAGRNGTAWLVANRPDLRSCQYALGEGGGWALELHGRSFVTIQTAEKGVSRFAIPAGSPARPGSHGIPESLTWHQSPINATAVEFTSRIAGLPAPVLRRLPTRTVAAIARRAQAGAQFMVDSDSMLMHGCQTTRDASGRVTVTCRPLPGTSNASLMGQFCRKTHMALPCGVGDPIEAAESALAPAVRSALETAGGSRLVPIVTGGPSDNHWLREAGITTFGFFPGPTAAEVMRIHRPDEHVSLAAFVAAVDKITAAVRSLYRIPCRDA